MQFLSAGWRVAGFAALTTLLGLFCVACGSSHDAAEKPVTGTVRAAISTSDYKSLILGDGAVGYWRLGDTGSTAVDAAPRGNNGTYVGTYTDSPIPNQNQAGALLGDSDTSAQFYYSNNYNHSPPSQTNWVSVPSDPNQSPLGTSLSVEAWFTMTPGTPQTYSAIVSKSTGNWQDGYGIYWYSNNLYFFINNLNTRIGIPLSAMGDTTKFHHVVGTYDGTYIRIYYDGVLASRGPLSSVQGKNNPVYAPPAPLQIGKSWMQLGWAGRIDEVAIYPNTLNDHQILSHFQAGRPPGPLSRAFVAYAQQSITFGTGVKVSGGDVGVASLAPQSAGPQLVVGASDVFDPQRGLFAPSVSLGSQAQVGGVSTINLDNSNNASILGTQQSFPTSMPNLPLVPTGAPGTTNVTIAAGRTTTVFPGSYGALVVNGTAKLPVGSYSFSSITVGAGGIVAVAPFGNTTVRVDTTVNIGTGATVFQQNQLASGFVLSVAGADSSSSSPAVSIGANSAFVGILNAPRGTISLGDGAAVVGALSAFAINAGNNVSLALDPAATAVADQAAGQQKLSGYITPQMAQAPLVGAVPPATPIAFSISLPTRVPTDGFPSLTDLAQQVSDPKSARYRQYLTDAQFANEYQPSDADYNALSAFAQSKGFTVVNTYPDKEMIDVSGTVGRFGAMLHAQMNYYQRPDGSTFYAIDREPSIDLVTSILHVGGTNNFVLPSTGMSMGIGSGDSGWLISKDLRTAYVSNCEADLDGKGQSITVLAFQDVNFGDLHDYDQFVGIPDPVFEEWQWQPTGLLSNFTQVDPANGGHEAPGDIELAHAMAPAADIVFYVAPNNDGGGVFHNFMADVFHGAAHPPGGRKRSNQVTLSWFVSSDDDIRRSLDEMAAFGQTFATCSGDGGSSTGNPQDVRTYDKVTLVGGTALTSFGSGLPPSEVAWSGSGGGYMGPSSTWCNPARGSFCDSGVGLPWYQIGLSDTVSHQAIGSFRNYPDISMVADGIESFFTSQGAPGDRENFSGTSASAPLFAGFMALVNERAAQRGIPPAGFVNPALYGIGMTPGLASSFNDVTSGSTPHTDTEHGGVPMGDPISGGAFSAVPGWDFATGWGTPTCRLIDQLASIQPLIPWSPPPPPLSAFPQAIGISHDNACAIVDSYAACWGFDQHGENGDGINGVVDTNTHLSPVCTSVAGQVSAVACGDSHCCAILPNGLVNCWGGNTFGQLGRDAVDSSTGQLRPTFTPVTIEGLPTNDVPTQIRAGGGTTCVVLASGALWCWGKNDFGQLGLGFADSGPHPVPAQVLSLHDPVQEVSVALSGNYVCVVDAASTNVLCWGTGALGDGVSVSSSSLTPQAVQGSFARGALRNAVSLSAGNAHACAIVTGSDSFGDGAYCWGSNDSGQLGLGTTTDTTVATQVVQMPGRPISVAAGGSSTCSLLDTSQVVCWGDDSVGQLGNGVDLNGTARLAPQPTPVQVNLDAVSAVYGGPTRFCAQSRNNVLCWGGLPVGDGTNNSSSSPVLLTFNRCL